ncbi:MAG: hypothetical protein NZ930_01915 [Candidatus Bipolaricaulota bacterium]|nr:hypothetical protein [Candidatus Bipolaricaulota bacterium]MDW8030951.1 hypothetical protein [Candidatus Bipolaricaulota bacterium]
MNERGLRPEDLASYGKLSLPTVHKVLHGYINPCAVRFKTRWAFLNLLDIDLYQYDIPPVEDGTKTRKRNQAWKEILLTLLAAQKPLTYKDIQQATGYSSTPEYQMSNKILSQGRIYPPPAIMRSTLSSSSCSPRLSPKQFSRDKSINIFVASSLVFFQLMYTLLHLCGWRLQRNDEVWGRRKSGNCFQCCGGDSLLLFLLGTL